MVFLLVWAGEAVSSEPGGDGGSGVSGLGALAGSCVCSSASPRSDRLMSLSVRSISPSLSRGAAVLFYFVKCCVGNATKCYDPCQFGQYFQHVTLLSFNLSRFETRALYPIV